MHEETINITVTIRAEDEAKIHNGCPTVTKVVVDGNEVERQLPPPHHGGYFWSVWLTPEWVLWLEEGDF